MLSSTNPPRVLAKTSKSTIIEHMVEMWNILLHMPLLLVKLGKEEGTICTHIFSSSN
jgi:hypothetical protein